jgi:hypothetical protein
MLDNIEKVRSMLAEQTQAMIEGHQTPAVLDSLVNAAGKMVATVKVQLEYAKLVGATAEIDFMSGEWLKKS